MESNRAFLYGDGLFETMRTYQGQVLWATAHAARLTRGMQVLGLTIEQQTAIDADWLQIRVAEALPAEGTADYRVRGTFFRTGGGLYTPVASEAAYEFQVTPLAQAPYPFPTKGLNMGLIQRVQLHHDVLAPLKTLNALPYVLAGLERQEQGWDDGLLTNTDGYLAEAQAANLFVIEGETVYTPSLDQGCVDGVLRAQLLRVLRAAGWRTVEDALTLERLETAEEVWLTNAIQGLRWVESIEGYAPKYRNGKLKQAHRLLLEAVKAELGV